MRSALLMPLMVLATPAPAQPYFWGPEVAPVAVLPPAIRSGSVEYDAGRATFRATRALAGSARWRQAIGYGNEATPAPIADVAAATEQPVSPTATVAPTRMHGDRTRAVGARRGLDPARAIMARIADPTTGPIVVAHRGCHAAAPLIGRGSVPENSLAALAQCVAIGADVMETDVRMTRDGHLVMIHDATVDRTTDGHGRVADMTLADIRALHLRDDLGGPGARLTGARVSTLAEMLDAAAGRIVLNLDIKDAVHAETIAAVLKAGAQDRILVKATAGIGSPPLAALPPFARVPFLPMLSGGEELPQVIARQAQGRIRPLGYEIPRMSLAVLAPTVTAARAAHGRLWANTLWDGFVAGVGGDEDALRDPDRVWGRLIRAGVSMLQTDHPSELKRFVETHPALSSGTTADR